MEFNIVRNALQKELGFLQGIVEKKNTIPALSNILIESDGDNKITITGTDLDVTLKCETEADVKTPGSLCVQARKLFDISRLLPDALVHFRKDTNNWASVKCERSSFRVAGIDPENFPEVPTFRSTPVKLASDTLKMFIDRTIFAITLEESRYTLSGAKFIFDQSGIRMITTDGHRLAYIEQKNINDGEAKQNIDALIPRKTLAELVKLTASFDGDIGLGTDDNHIYFEVGSRLLVSRTLAGQFPNYEMVIPKNNDKSVVFDCAALGQAIRRVALMADDRSRAIKMLFGTGNLQISSQTAEEGEATESLIAEYQDSETEIGFNAQYLQDFLTVMGEGKVSFEFKDAGSQAQLRPADNSDYIYKYVVMPMRL